MTSSAKQEPRSKRSSPLPSNLTAYLATFQDYQPIEWVRSGVAAIDLVIGGGIPRGRFIEVVGEPSTAKSAYVYTVIGAFQRAGAECVLIDSEAKADKEFVERLGVNFEKLHYAKGATIDECIRLLGNVAKMADPKQPVLVVWDSLASTPGAWEMEQHMDEKKEFTGEKASRARLFSAAFRAVLGDLTRKQVTFIGVNQLRTKFNFMGSTSMEAPGGKAIKYHSALRLMMRMRGRVKHKTHDVVTGMLVECEAIKNTLAAPFRKCQVRLDFATGFAMYSGLDELLLRHGRIQQKAGWLVYKDKTFRAGDLERVITEMPDLLDPLNSVIGDNVAPIDLSSGEAKEGSTEPATETAAAAENED